MSDPVILVVLGRPAPKGSMRALVRAGRPCVVPGGSNVGRDRMRSWATAVREVASTMTAPMFVGRALRVDIVFGLSRPGGHYRKDGTLRPSAPAYPSVKPDLDKLIRNTWDALTGSVFDDDARIAQSSARKVWAAPGQEGATIRVEVIA